MQTQKKYFVAYNNQQYGPMSWEELTRNYPPQTLIWTEGMSNWQPMNSVAPPPPSHPQPTSAPNRPSPIQINLSLKDRKVGWIVSIIGALLLTYGIIQYSANKPKMFASSIGDWIGAFASNIEKVEKREKATRVMILGGVITAGGIVLLIISQNSQLTSGKRYQNRRYY